ncbi:MAG: DUF3344 domain-containing protein [Methanoregula sp.]|nr:DUF3344 domain-containing protein [Methanoregula sp.]
MYSSGISPASRKHALSGKRRRAVRAGLKRVRSFRPIHLFLLIGIVFLVSVASANPYYGGIPLKTEQSGVVSGGLWFDAYPGFATSAQKPFTLPKHTTIDWARVYVGVYCGHMQNNYNGVAHVTFDSDGDGVYETSLGDESLNVPYSFPGDGGSGPVIVSDHVNRVTSDYLMWYDVKDKITGNNVGVSVKTEKGSPSFDGRIKFIALVVAYNDDSNNKVYYWVNQGHDAMNSNKDDGYVGETTFSTSKIPSESDDEAEVERDAKLSVLYMASSDGTYTFNSEEKMSGTPRGAYFGSDSWTDVIDSIVTGEDSTLEYKEGTGTSSSYGETGGVYFKIPLALLSVTVPQNPTGTLLVTSNPPGADISIDDENTQMQTNVTISGISTGEHTIQVRLANNQSYREPDENSVTITENGNATVHFDLEQINGSIDVSSDPKNAWVFLDGSNRSVQTDTTLDSVMVGDHTVTLKKSGFADQSTSVTVSEDETSSVSLVLTNSSGSNETAIQAGPSDSIGYGGRSLSLYHHGTINGGLIVANDSEYSGLMEKDASKSYAVSMNIPQNATVKDARLYVYTTWSHNAGDLTGKKASLQVTYNGDTLREDHRYLDRKGYGIYDYPAETLCYSINPDFLWNGTQLFTVTNTGIAKDEVAVYGIVMVAVYEDPRDLSVEYWIGEGSDVIYANPEFQITSENATTKMVFPGNIDTTGLTNAKLIAISTAASGTTDDDNQVTFNGRQWNGVLTAGSSDISIATFDVTDDVVSQNNNATMVSNIVSKKGDYMENRNFIFYITKDREDTSDGDTSPSEEESLNMTVANATPSQDLSELSSSAPASGPAVEIIDPTRQKYAVRVLSNPAGALISVDYQYTGKTTPATIEPLQGGNHTISVEQSGFAPAEERIFVTTNETLKFDMSSAGSKLVLREKVSENQDSLLDQETYGGIYVQSSPDNAVIYVDGKKTSLATPSVIYGLQKGKHTIKIMKKGSIMTGSEKENIAYPVDTKDVWVDNGVITPVSFSTAENPYVLSPVFNSSAYAGLEFTVNGQMKKYSFPSSVSLQSSSSDNYLTIKQNDSYRSHMIVFSIDPTKIQIEPRAYTFWDLDVDSDPAGADIYLDGFSTGYTTPYTIHNVSDGEHIVTLSKPGYLPAESVVNVDNKDLVRRFVMQSYLYGMLNVTSDPPGGKIYINNKNTGEKTPFTFQYMQAGEYTIKVVQNKLQDTAVDVMVDPYKCKDVNLILTEAD